MIDDGSIDETAAEAAAEGAAVIRHPYNLGIGGAVQSGFKYALRNGYQVAAQVDGDGQHKPEYLPTMVAALHTEGEQADMVYGSRFRGDPGYRVPLGRRLGNMVFSVVLSAITRQKITDPTSGFRMTNRRGIELFARDYPHDYPEVEALLMLHANRLRDPRGAREDERARVRPELDRLPAQRLLHAQGAARAVRRPVSPPGDAGRGGRGMNAARGLLDARARRSRRPAPSRARRRPRRSR